MNGKFRRLKRYELFWPVNSAAGITWEGYADDADDALVRALTELPVSLTALIVERGGPHVPIIRELAQEARMA